MSRTSKVLPLFVAGKEASIIAAVAEGGVLHDLDGIAYGFAKDTGKSCYISLDHEIQWMVGDNKPLVQRVTALPEEGDAEVLYILGGTVYSWDAENEVWVPTYRDVTERLDGFDERISAVTQLVGTLSGTVTELATEVSALPTVEAMNIAIASGVSEAKSYADGVANDLETALNASISAVSARVDSADNDIAAIQGNIASIGDDISSMQGDIAELKETGTETEEKVEEVEQTVKDYTDQKIDDVISYVNSTFELKEV